MWVEWKRKKRIGMSADVSFDPQLVRVARYLQSSPKVKKNECVLQEKRVEVMKGGAATKALLDAAFAKAMGPKGPKVVSEEEAQNILQKLLQEGMLMRVRSINNTRFMQADHGRSWSDESLYAWLWEETQWMPYIGGILAVLLLLGAMMFPLWPFAIRSKVNLVMNWAMWAAIGFLLFLFITSIVRAIFYAVTSVILKPGIWIFPNLWEDVGFFESFWPLWDWEKGEVPSGDKQTTTQ